MQIWPRPKWAQVIASQHKCTQGLAERTSKLTQVFNLPLLAIPFGQGLKMAIQRVLNMEEDIFVIRE